MSPDRDGTKTRVVTVGGGTGSSVLLRGLKRYRDRLEVTAIVTTFDDGGSSGELRHRYGVPALGDVRRCIGALATEESLAEMFEQRFQGTGEFANHALGNLALFLQMQHLESLQAAIDEVSRVLGCVGRVLAVTSQTARLNATLIDGTTVYGEHNIDRLGASDAEIESVGLDRRVDISEDASVALSTADVVILAPGDLYTSVIPNLLVGGVAECLQRPGYRLVHVCNVANKPGATDDYAASHHVRAILRYLNRERSTARPVDAVVLDDRATTSRVAPDGCPERVKIDRDVGLLARDVITAKVSSPENHCEHNPGKLARVIADYIDSIE